MSSNPRCMKFLNYSASTNKGPQAALAVSLKDLLLQLMQPERSAASTNATCPMKISLRLRASASLKCALANQTPALQRNPTSYPTETHHRTLRSHRPWQHMPLIPSIGKLHSPSRTASTEFNLAAAASSHHRHSSTPCGPPTLLARTPSCPDALRDR